MNFFSFLKSNSTNKPVIKVINPNPFIKKSVKPDNTPLFVRRGWTMKKDNKYQGYYRTTYGAWRGEINRRGDKFKVFIFNPPVEHLENHSRWPCFVKKGKNKWEIDLAINPRDRDISAIIFYVERIIVESFNRKEG